MLEKETLYRVDILSNSTSGFGGYTFRKTLTRQAAYVLYTYLTNLGEDIGVYETTTGFYLLNPLEELLKG